MEILKALSENEITALRDLFDEREEGLDARAFEAVLTDACKTKPSINTQQLRLRELFSEIDSSGDGFVNWEEFTMYIINRTDGKHKAASGTGLDGVVKNYLLSYTFEDEIPKTIVEMRYIERQNKIVKLVRDRGVTRMRVCQNDNRLSTYFDAPRAGSNPMSCFEYIPSSQAQNSNCLAVAYSDAYLRLIDMQKRRLTMNNEVRVLKTIRLAESQTVMRWSPRYQRLIMGSRTGILSVLHPDEQSVFSQEKLHALLVADMVVDDTLLFTASVDPVDSVKCTDLQRSVVRYALNDHPQGATLIAVNPAFQTLFSVGFELHIVSHAMLMPRVKPWKLFDSARPHRGRITHLKLVPNTPQLISSDTCGLTKLWDIRMNSCVQNILPPKDELEITPPEMSAASSICVIGPSKRIIINGRNTAVYCYEGATDPAIADEVPAHLVLLNASTQTILTVHQRTVKHWDVATGELTSTRKDLLPNEITAGVIVQPMERKIFFGTSTGGVFKFSFALCEFEKDLSHYCVQCKGEEVLDLVPVTGLRESSTPYVVAAFRQDILLLPDVDGHSVKGSVEVKALRDVMAQTTRIKCVTLCRGTILLVGCSDGVVRAVDLSTLGLLSSWSDKSCLRGDVISLSVAPFVGSNTGCVAFASSGCGKVACGMVCSATAAWDTVDHWEGTEHCEIKPMTLLLMEDGDEEEDDYSLIGGGGEHSHLNKPSEGGMISMLTPLPMPLMAASNSGNGPTPQSHHKHDSRASSSHGSGIATDRTNDGNTRTPRPEQKEHQNTEGSAVTAYLDAKTKSERDTLLGSVIVVVQYLPSHQLLVTGDERGSVTIWDVQPCMRHAGLFASDPITAPSVMAQPRLMRWWRAHDEEIVCLVAFFEKESQRLCVLTASNDKLINLWSADGVLLGNLALGRDDIATVLAAGVQPYLLHETDNAKYWKNYESYIAQRNADTSNNSTTPLLQHTALTSRGGLGSAVPPSSQRKSARPANTSACGTPLPPIDNHYPMITQFSASVSINPEMSVANTIVAGNGSTFFVTQTMSMEETNQRGSAIAMTEVESSSVLLDANAIMRRFSRFNGVVKPTAVATSRLKRDRMPAHLTSHSGVLPQSQRLPSPRTHLSEFPAPSPSPPALTRGKTMPSLAMDRKQIIFSPRQPKQPLSTDPPSPYREHESQQAKRVLRLCRERESAHSPHDFLERNGAVVLCASPDLPPPLPPRNEDERCTAVEASRPITRGASSTSTVEPSFRALRFQKTMQ